MQYVIDGKVYDTDKATSVADVSVDNRGYLDCESVLYITEKENWFIVKSEYPSSYEEVNHYENLQMEVPARSHEPKALTADEAYTWLCENDKGKALKMYFPDRIEDAQYGESKMTDLPWEGNQKA